MYAIVTKYLPATNTKGARITASDGVGKRVTIPYPHELSGEFVHREAAMAFVKRNGYNTSPGRVVDTVLAPGPLANSSGYVYVWCDKSCERGYAECQPFKVSEDMLEGTYAVPAWTRGLVHAH